MCVCVCVCVCVFVRALVKSLSSTVLSPECVNHAVIT